LPPPPLTKTKPLPDLLQQFRTNELILLVIFLLRQVSPRKRLRVLAWLRRFAAEGARVSATERFDWITEQLKKPTLPTLRGRYARTTKGDPWLPLAYDMLMQVHRESNGAPRAIRQRLEAYRTMIETTNGYLMRIFPEVEDLLLGPVLPWERLATCSLDHHAAQNERAHHSAFALDTLAEMTGQDDQDAVRRQILRVSERQRRDWNAAMSSLGKPPVLSRHRGRQRRETRTPEDRFFLGNLQSKVLAVIRRSAQ
jgi:hypothetical protein